MTLAVKLLLIAALVLGIIIPFGTFLLGEKSKKRYKRTIGANAFFFFGAFVVAGIMLFSGMPAQAAEAAGTALIFVGLAEGVCLYGLIISFMILGKL